MTTYFGFGLADSMFPHNCYITRTAVSVDEVKEEIAKGGVVSCVNPSHKLTLDALNTRFGIMIDVPAVPPIVKLEPGDALIVMGVSGLPRLVERHEYTQTEIDEAEFRFGFYDVR